MNYPQLIFDVLLNKIEKIPAVFAKLRFSCSSCGFVYLIAVLMGDDERFILSETFIGTNISARLRSKESDSSGYYTPCWRAHLFRRALLIHLFTITSISRAPYLVFCRHDEAFCFCIQNFPIAIKLSGWSPFSVFILIHVDRFDVTKLYKLTV